MAYFLFQTALLSTVAVISGTIIGWWLHYYYGSKSRKFATSSDKDLTLVKDYLAQSIKENARLKMQLKQTEEKLDSLVKSEIPIVDGVDFEAYKAFENTVKEVNLRKYLN